MKGNIKMKTAYTSAAAELSTEQIKELRRKYEELNRWISDNLGDAGYVFWSHNFSMAELLYLTECRRSRF